MILKFLASLLPWLAAALLVAGNAAAQDEVDELGQVEQAVEQVNLQPEQFEQWVFGNRKASVVRARLDWQLVSRVEGVVQSCGATELQRQKLVLAGQGDIKRLFDQVDVLRDEFQSLRHNQQGVNEILVRIQPLQARLASGVFEEDSLFQKTLRRNLDAEQAAACEQAERERRAFLYRAKFEAVIANFGGVLGLRAEQRLRLADLLLEATSPPWSFGQYDYYVVMIQMCRLPEERLKPIFDEVQWRVLSQQFNQVRQVEPHLKKIGVLPDAAPPVAQPKPAPPAAQPKFLPPAGGAKGVPRAAP